MNFHNLSSTLPSRAVQSYAQASTSTSSTSATNTHPSGRLGGSSMSYGPLSSTRTSSKRSFDDYGNTEIGANSWPSGIYSLNAATNSVAGGPGGSGMNTAQSTSSNAANDASGLQNSRHKRRRSLLGPSETQTAISQMPHPRSLANNSLTSTTISNLSFSAPERETTTPNWMAQSSTFTPAAPHQPTTSQSRFLAATSTTQNESNDIQGTMSRLMNHPVHYPTPPATTTTGPTLATSTLERGPGGRDWPTPESFVHSNTITTNNEPGWNFLSVDHNGNYNTGLIHLADHPVALLPNNNSHSNHIDNASRNPSFPSSFGLSSTEQSSFPSPFQPIRVRSSEPISESPFSRLNFNPGNHRSTQSSETIVISSDSDETMAPPTRRHTPPLRTMPVTTRRADQSSTESALSSRGRAILGSSLGGESNGMLGLGRTERGPLESRPMGQSDGPSRDRNTASSTPSSSWFPFISPSMWPARPSQDNGSTGQGNRSLSFEPTHSPVDDWDELQPWLNPNTTNNTDPSYLFLSGDAHRFPMPQYEPFPTPVSRPNRPDRDSSLNNLLRVPLSYPRPSNANASRPAAPQNVQSQTPTANPLNANETTPSGFSLIPRASGRRNSTTNSNEANRTANEANNESTREDNLRSWVSRIESTRGDLRTRPAQQQARERSELDALLSRTPNFPPPRSVPSVNRSQRAPTRTNSISERLTEAERVRFPPNLLLEDLYTPLPYPSRISPTSFEAPFPGGFTGTTRPASFEMEGMARAASPEMWARYRTPSPPPPRPRRLNSGNNNLESLRTQDRRDPSRNEDSFIEAHRRFLGVELPASWLESADDSRLPLGLSSAEPRAPRPARSSNTSRRRAIPHFRPPASRYSFLPSRFRSLGDYMDDDEFDDSYEGLMALGQSIGQVKKGCSKETLNKLPCGKYSEFSSVSNDKAVGDNGNCAICLEDYKPEDNCLKLPRCSHFYHKDCVKEWLKSAKTCPVCRETVEGTPRLESAEAARNSLRARFLATEVPSRPEWPTSDVPIPAPRSSHRSTAPRHSRRRSTNDDIPTRQTETPRHEGSSGARRPGPSSTTTISVASRVPLLDTPAFVPPPVDSPRPLPMSSASRPEPEFPRRFARGLLARQMSRMDIEALFPSVNSYT
ncbi:hypothetical protein CPB86DRAFT_858380 [Serendipita vermifera]|nr:hypothetical protein CPB86DRAFT_858380 [Serendipita vermifera]